jgi:copper chaperone CopZ
VKTPLLLLVALAAAAAAYLAWSAPERDYQPLADAGVPSVLTLATPAGSVVRRLEVEGPCCDGCCEKLYAALMEVEGVTQAAVRLDAGRATAEAIVPQAVGAAELAARLTFDKYRARPAAPH